MCPAQEVYRKAILAEAPRVFGLMAREPFSAAAGCCDRTYWAWKFVDYPGARFQEAVCVMSFLYATPMSGNIYQGNDRVLEWASMGLRFWSSIQYPDGSFDEAYPYERSLAATSFTSFYAGEAVAFLGDALDGDTRSRVRRTFERAGDWLIRNDETHGFLSNHLAAAAAALYHAYRVTGEARFEARSRYFIDRILARQSKEGWYDEYGGADPGYQTHGSFYLARYAEMSGDQRVVESLARSMRFLAICVHPDGSLGGEYASRNTQTYYPAAFEMCAARDRVASWIAAAMRPSVESAAAAGLQSVDAYNYFPLLNNLVFAYRACAENHGRVATPEEPECAAPLVWFPEAGIARIRKPAYDAWVGTAKGGVIKVFDRARGRRVYSDCGYIGRLKTGRLFSTQRYEPARPVQVTGDRITVAGSFDEFSLPTMSPNRFVLFRLFSLTAGRLPGLARWMKAYLVKVLIYRKKTLDIRFERTIEFSNDRVAVNDEISGQDGERAESLAWSEVFTTIHMGSSRYFIPNELEESVCESHPRGPIDPRQIARGLRLSRTIAIGESA